MQVQLQLMCIQAMLVNNQLCSDSDKQYDPLKTISKFKHSISHTVCDLVRFNHYHKYGVVLEMPQKVCGGDILHVMAFAKNFEMPQNRTVSVFLFES